MAQTVDAELNVGMSKGLRAQCLRGTVSASSGYGVVPRSKQYVSKMTLGFFITINSMILYFKHIIHIDEFPSTGTRLVSTIHGCQRKSFPLCFVPV